MVGPLTRRNVILAGGLGLLTGCASYGPEEEPSAPKMSGTVEVKADEVPVGSGKVFGDQGVVVTQPAAGTYRAFTATCTHAGCTLAGVTDTINCNCHGSKFSVTDGSVVNGPATSPLKAYSAAASGDTIRITA
jgi:Rieske Fe-S protein